MTIKRNKRIAQSINEEQAAISVDVDLIPGVGYFVVGGGRTLIYDNSHELLLNLDTEYADADLMAFVAREFPEGLTNATAESWLARN